jgi:flagellar motor switch/type III secretory pathway protein FliN
MSDFFHKRGTLTVVIGQGWLSSFEVGSLKVGDVVRTGQIAGRPAMIRYNGCEMGPCEVVIIGDLFGARVTGTEPLCDAVPVPGTRDDLAELLPTEVVLGSIEVSPEELHGVGRNTIVSLGTPFSESADAELRAAGMPLARGKVVVIEEEMGIRIAEVLARPSMEADIRASGFLLDPNTRRRVKDYDFRRPDKFTKIAIDNIHDTHILFLRNLGVRLPDIAASLPSGPAQAATDQCTFEESQHWMAAAGRFTLFAAENLGARRPEHDPTDGSRWAARGKALLEENGTAHPVAPESRRFIDELENVRDYVNRQPVLIYHRAGTAVSEALRRGGTPEALLACLRGGWKNLVDLNLKPVPADDPFAREPWIPAHDMVILVSFDAPDGKPALVIVYPYLTLEPLMGVLG